MTSFQLARTHLWRKKISTAIALLGIALSVATSGVLLRIFLLSQARFASLAQTGDAIVGAKGSDIGLLLGCLNLEGPYPDFVPGVLYESLASRKAVHFEDGATADQSPVETAIPFVIFAQVQDYRVLATNELFLQTRYSTLPHLAEGTWVQGLNEVVVGASVAQNLHLKLQDEIKGETWIDKDHQVQEPLAFKVVGILQATDKSWDRGLYSNLESAQNVFAKNQASLRSIWKNNLMHYFLIYLSSDHRRAFTGMAWLKTLINQRTVAQVVAVDEEVKRLKELTGTQQDLGLFIAAVIIFLGALTTAAVMITRFESMGQQLAILRALGYSKARLRGILLWEAFLLGLIACTVGAGVDGLTFPWIRSLLGSSLPAESIASIGLWHSYLIWLMALLGCLLSILVPLWRLSRQNIHLSLRNL